MIIKSYSKINLTLRVNSKSKNNLHEIQSFFCLINLFDEISIKKNKKKRDEISFYGPFSKLIKSKSNSVYKILKKLRDLKIISCNYSIKIKKNIPIFGGLAGGTSNAAYIFKSLYKYKVNKRLFEKLESIVGSDLSLFFMKQGFLKNLKKIIELKKKHKFDFVLIHPNIKCYTKEIYAKVKKFSKKDQLDNNVVKSKIKLLNYLSKNRNDLQFIVEKKYPIIKKILKDIKKQKGCCFSRMTGSGSVCYGLFINQITAKKAINNLKKEYPKLWFSLAKTV